MKYRGCKIQVSLIASEIAGKAEKEHTFIITGRLNKHPRALPLLITEEAAQDWIDQQLDGRI